MENKSGVKIYLTILWILTIICILIGVGMRFGIVRDIRSFTTGISHQNGHGAATTTTTDEFSAINADIDAGSLVIKEGDAFGISYKLDERSKFDWSVKNGTLYITEKYNDNILFGTSFKGDEIEVTVPKGTSLKSIDLDVDMGNVELYGLVAAKLTVSADMGNVEGHDLTVDVCSLEADMGNIEIAGDFKDIEADCDMGAISIDVADLDNCKIDASADLGSITVNGVSQANEYKK